MSEHAINLEVAMEQFHKRQAANVGQQVNNSRLPAGSPMYYYCRYCGAHIITLPEGHFQTVCTVCRPCDVLREHGLI